MMRRVALSIGLLACQPSPLDSTDTGHPDTEDTAPIDTADTGVDDSGLDDTSVDDTDDSGLDDTSDSDSGLDDTSDSDSGLDDTSDSDTDSDDTGDPPVFEPGVYVALSGNDANPGTPQAPLRTVSAGLARAATAGGPVRVAAGVYAEQISVGGEVVGGYAPSTWAFDPAQQVTEIAAPDDTAPTVLVPTSTDGILRHLALSGPGTTLRIDGTAVTESLTVTSTTTAANEAVVHVGATTWNATDLVVTSNTAWGLIHLDGGTALLDGVTLIAGAADGRGIFAPGGLLALEDATIDGWLPIHATTASLFLDRVTLTGARAALTLEGGSAYLADSVLTATDGADASPVAVVHAAPGVLDLQRCVVYGPEMPALIGGHAMITNSVVRSGVTDAGFAVRLATGFLVHNAFAIDGATTHAAAIRSDSTVTLANNVFVLSGGSTRSAVLLPEDATVLLRHNLLWGPVDSAWVAFDPTDDPVVGDDVNDCVAWPRGCTSPTGNRVGDPHFVDWPDDVRLTAASVEAIDHGVDPTIWLGDTERVDEDHYGNPRPNVGWDIGPTEY